jgi:HEAT repeat protein
MSTAFDHFRFSFFEDTDSARQGLDLASLSALQGEERDRAEELLIHYLPDARGVIGLGVLRSRKAEGALLRLFEEERKAQAESARDPDPYWTPYGLIDLAKALWQIRLSAAEALYDVRDPSAAIGLTTALGDPEPLVRYHAARGLLSIYGITDAPTDPNHMIYRIMSKDTVRREQGKEEILSAIAGRPISEP